MPRNKIARLGSLLFGRARQSTAATGAMRANKILRSYHICGSPGILDPYDYTAGRWLKDDILQRESRRIEFDFTELCKKAVELCPNADRIQTCEKQEGGFNRVFLFTMNNGERIVAKLPSSICGPARLTTNSEVATMAYIRSKTTIPLPKVIAWSDNKTNPIGAEYIFMEHAIGVQLHDRWDDMSSYDHVRLIQNASLMIKQMAAIDFSGYGSLYFTDAPIDDVHKKAIGDGFCIGPHCGALYWNSAPGETSLYGASSADHGPWLSLQDFCRGLISSAAARMPDKSAKYRAIVPYHGSFEDHQLLLRNTASIITDLARMPVVQNVARSTLLHPDFHKRNIFVSTTDATKITAIIDWQGTSIEPAFVYATDTPDFAARPVGHVDGQIIDENGRPEKSGEARSFQDMLLCSDTFEVCMKGFVPTLGAARAVDDALLCPFRHCNTSWRDGIVVGQQNNIELARRWSELGLLGKCPYSPTNHEISAHQVRYEDFETSQTLKLGLMQRLGTDSDGWVSAQDWDVVKSAHEDMFREWIDTAGPNMTEARARYLWPFDAPLDSQAI